MTLNKEIFYIYGRLITSYLHIIDKRFSYNIIAKVTHTFSKIYRYYSCGTDIKLYFRRDNLLW